MAGKPLPLRRLNHVSFVVASVPASIAFYRDVLGFVEIKRPSSFEFDGGWLYGCGLGIHLIEGEPAIKRPSRINPQADHLSFQADNLQEVEDRLRSMGFQYDKEAVVEDGIKVSQIFFLDPDGHMIEVCNCDCLPIQPLTDSLCAAFSSCASQCQPQHLQQENQLMPLQPTQKLNTV